MDSQFEAEYAERLRLLLTSSRKKLGFTQEELATALGTGVVTIRRWETGHVGKSFPIDVFIGLSKLVDRPLDELISDVFGASRSTSRENTIFSGSQEKLRRLKEILDKGREFSASTSKRLLILARIFAQSDELLELEMFLAALKAQLANENLNLSESEAKEIRSEIEEAMRDWRKLVISQEK